MPKEVMTKARLHGGKSLKQRAHGMGIRPFLLTTPPADPQIYVPKQLEDPRVLKRTYL